MVKFSRLCPSVFPKTLYTQGCKLVTDLLLQVDDVTLVGIHHQDVVKALREVQSVP